MSSLSFVLQMTDIAENVLTEDSAWADESDPDKRVSKLLWEKMVVPDNEFEEGKSGNRNESVAKKDPGKSDEAMEVDNVAPGEAKPEAVNFLKT